MNKINFAVIFEVEGANPNGDPLNENRPRQDHNRHGEVSAECIKRKIRNRLMNFYKKNPKPGNDVFYQSNDNRLDDCKSLKERLGSEGLKKIKKDRKEAFEYVCGKWIDVRMFGVTAAFEKKSSLGVKGPITFREITSVAPVIIKDAQITKSMNGDSNSDQSKGSDTMGMKYVVQHGHYVVYGSISSELADKTKLNNNDIILFKESLRTLFENDESSARPDGSMRVLKVIWWEHSCENGQYSSYKVHNTLTVNSDGTYNLNNFNDLIPEEIDGW